MLSIYPKHVLEQIYPLGLLPNDRVRDTIHLVALAQFFVKNAQLAIKNYEKEKLTYFDPLVRDRVCQRHAQVVLSLFRNSDVKAEVERLKTELKNADKRIQAFKNKPHFDPEIEQITLATLATFLGIQVNISEKVELLFLAHLLTTFERVKSNEPFPSRTINYDRLRSTLSKSLSLDEIKKIISLARTTFSEGSARYFSEIVSQLEKFPSLELKLLKERIQSKETFVATCEVDTVLTMSNAFYSSQAVLQIAREQQQLLLIKEYRNDKSPPIGLYYRAATPQGSFVSVSPPEKITSQSVLVFLGLISPTLTKEKLAENIQAATFEKVISANAALCTQFANEDLLEKLDEEGQKEVLNYRHEAVKLGCAPDDLRFIHIVHVNPSTVQEEKIR